MAVRGRAAALGGRTNVVVAVMGRQGSGKGTQGERLARRFGMLHLSTGDLLRTAVAARTPLGLRVEKALAAGDLVGDEVMVPLVAERLREARAGAVLDGFPRTVAQAVALERFLGRGVDIAVHLVVPLRTVTDRLLARRVCVDCGTTAAVTNGRVSSCDVCGGELVRRLDDTEAAIARRLALYDEQTAPVLAWFAARSCLVEVDGARDINAVASDVAGVVSAYATARPLTPA